MELLFISYCLAGKYVSFVICCQMQRHNVLESVSVEMKISRFLFFAGGSGYYERENGIVLFGVGVENKKTNLVGRLGFYVL